LKRKQGVLERIFLMSILAFCCSLFAAGNVAAEEDEGEKLFAQVCVACHTIGGGKLIGPDLANVHQRRPEEWLLKFIKSSQSVVASGDEYAVTLFEEFLKIPMPDNNYTDEQIRAIIAYIASNSGNADVPVDVAEMPKEITEENIQSGKALFTGTKRFENGGASCASCHNVDRAGVRAGGALAKDLTDAHTRLSAAGVRAVIARSPFPIMSIAFEDKPLTSQEVFDVAAFLQFVDEDPSARSGTYYPATMAVWGLGSIITLIGLMSAMSMYGKRRTVNHDIYRRQTKSS
jgi:mono/diheme cytochrome c family protein